MLCFVAVARAEPVTIELEVPGRLSEEPVGATVFATRFGEPEVSAAQTVEVTDQTILDLEPGDWSLVAAAAGFWSPRASISVQGPETRIQLKLWPTGWLEGTLWGPPGEDLPTSFDLLFRSRPGIERAQSIPLGQVACPVTEATWRCEVPAGVLDVQMVASGFIRRFDWDVEVEVGEVTRLGRVKLQRGSAVIGWVVAEDGSGVDGSVVELLPSEAVRPHDPATQSRFEALRLSTEANHRGFFQLDAVKPGDYVLTASREPLSSARVTVRVLDGKTTEVAEPPLTLRQPRTLELFVDPPSPPGLDHWTAELLQLDTRGNVMGVFAEGIIPPNGSWMVEAIGLGNYFLTIATSNGDRWHQQSLKIDSDPTPVFVTIPAVEVRGRVLLGKEPLPARLVFGGKYGAQTSTLVADEKGDFAGLLPREGLWEIEIDAEDPPISRSVQKEILEGEALEIVLPDTRVRGVVVDEGGNGIGRAIVRVTPLAEPQMAANPLTDEDGRFEIFGLPAGRTVFTAETAARYSESLEILIADSQDTSGIRLVLRETLKLTGRVVSDAGGVPGAGISTILPDVPFWGSPNVGSDADGYFELALPAATRHVILNVSAPGFAFRTLRVAAQEPLVIPVGTESGTLTLEIPESLDMNRWGASSVAVFHRAGSVALSQLITWAGFHGFIPDSKRRFQIPFMEPGEYSMCLVEVAKAPAILAGDRTGLHCASGDLPVFGELTLELEAD